MPAMVLAALLVLSSAPGEVLRYTVRGVERSALVYAPSKQSDHPPLVFCFHGHGGNSRQASRSFHIHEEWPEAVVVYMQGLPTKGMTDPKGAKPGWQQKAGDYEDRDLAFFDTVWEDVLKRFSPDLDRAYSMGHSNGGRFSYLLWAERGDRFAAFAPSGSPALLLRLAPKPVFHIAGEKDPLVPFSSQSRTLDSIKRLDGCAKEGEALANFATLYRGENGNDVVTYFHPGGHEYPSRVGPKLIVDFFKGHPRRASG